MARGRNARARNAAQVPAATAILIPITTSTMSWRALRVAGSWLAELQGILTDRRCDELDEATVRRQATHHTFKVIIRHIPAG